MAAMSHAWLRQYEHTVPGLVQPSDVQGKPMVVPVCMNTKVGSGTRFCHVKRNVRKEFYGTATPSTLPYTRM
eukprot:2258094-Amphidinium_carterae.1